MILQFYSKKKNSKKQNVYQSVHTYKVIYNCKNPKTPCLPKQKTVLTKQHCITKANKTNTYFVT